MGSYFLRLQNGNETLEAEWRLPREIAKIKPYKPRKATGIDIREFASEADCLSLATI
jgi:hypothetical protein